MFVSELSKVQVFSYLALFRKKRLPRRNFKTTSTNGLQKNFCVPITFTNEHLDGISSPNDLACNDQYLHHVLFIAT